MNCPNCNSNQTKVTWSHDEGDHVKRRRKCLSCNYRFNTSEITGVKVNKMKSELDKIKEFRKNGRILISMSQLGSFVSSVEGIIAEVETLPEISIKNDKVY